MSIRDLRREYEAAGLRETEVDPNPVTQFARWMEAAVAAGLPEPNAMTLATAAPDGRPAARMVLLRGFDARGFVFFSNHESRKGRELTANPWAALVFFWPELHRQVRIEGRVGLVDAAEADAYFASRPEGSRLGAWASPQSQVIEGRDTLDRRVQEVTARFAGHAIPRPPFWGGYRVAPDLFEFWQGQPSRLHDRLRYQRATTSAWEITRLAP